MTKIIISSLFTYDPLVSAHELSLKGRGSALDLVANNDEIDMDIMGAVNNTLKQYVANEIVQAVMLCVMKKELDNLTLLLDERTDPIQEEALQIIKKKIGSSAEVEVTRVNGNDTLSVAREVVNSIESFDKGDEICINISSLKNAKTLGMIYGGYVRSERVSEICYLDKTERRIIRIPKLSLELTKKQKQILQFFRDLQEGRAQKPKTKIYDKFQMDKSSYYYILNELKIKGFLEKDQTVTEMGEVALL